MFESKAPDHISRKLRDRNGARDAEAMSRATIPVSSNRRGGRNAVVRLLSGHHSLETMPTELAPSVAEDSTLPLFAVPAEIRQWGARVRVADRNPVRAISMLVETM